MTDKATHSPYPPCQRCRQPREHHFKAERCHYAPMRLHVTTPILMLRTVREEPQPTFLEGLKQWFRRLFR